LKYVKNLLVVILVLTAFVLTERLWFEEYSNRNFFYSFIPYNATVAANQESSRFVTPYRMVAGTGNNTYYILYNNLDSNKLKQQADSVIKNVLNSGQFKESKKLDWQELLTPVSVMYEYNLMMPVDTFAAGYGQKAGNLSAKLKGFNSIILTPGSDGTINADFLDLSSRISYSYQIKDQKSAQSLSQEISSIKGLGLYYISSSLSGFGYFLENTFIPQWHAESYVYPAVSTINPYGELLLRNIGDKLDSFFNNPAGKLMDTINGVYTYGDESVVVKYYDSNVLEYSNYATIDRSTESSLLSDYGAAVAFIKNDELISNDFYLSSYAENEDTRTFCFNYALNDIPLILSDKLYEKADLNYPIEVTVERGTVIKYRKLVYNFILAEEAEEYPAVDFVQALNGVISVNQQAESEHDAISAMELGYLIDTKSVETMDLKEQLYYTWYFKIDGQVYNRSAQ